MSQRNPSPTSQARRRLRTGGLLSVSPLSRPSKPPTGPTAKPAITLLALIIFRRPPDDSHTGAPSLAFRLSFASTIVVYIYPHCWHTLSAGAEFCQDHHYLVNLAKCSPCVAAAQFRLLIHKFSSCTCDDLFTVLALDWRQKKTVETGTRPGRASETAHR
jgi:hypothetical protein